MVFETKASIQLHCCFEGIDDVKLQDCGTVKTTTTAARLELQISDNLYLAYYFCNIFVSLYLFHMCLSTD